MLLTLFNCHQGSNSLAKSRLHQDALRPNFHLLKAELQDVLCGILDVIF